MNGRRTDRYGLCPLTDRRCCGELCAWYCGPIDGRAMAALADAPKNLAAALRDVERGPGAGPGEGL